MYSCAARKDNDLLTNLTVRVFIELEAHLHISEKAVAEFIIDLAKGKRNVDDFKVVRELLG